MDTATSPSTLLIIGATDPVPEPVMEPVMEPMTEPPTLPATEPVTQPAPQSTTQPASAPKSETSTQPSPLPRLSPRLLAPKIRSSTLPPPILHLRSLPQLPGDSITDLANQHTPQSSDAPPSYLWHRVIPLHQLSVIAGPPGCGKSLIALDIAARHSRRDPFPGESTSPLRGTTLIFAPLDHPQLTTRARLLAAGADPDSITVLTDITDPESGESRPFNLLTDHAALESAIHAHHITLLIIDPLDAFFSVAGPAAAFRAMRLLADIARRTGITIVATAHTSPDTRGRFRRLAGPLPLTTAPRIIWEVQQVGPAQRTLQPLKWTFSDTPLSFTCALADGRLAWTDHPAAARLPEPMPPYAPRDFETCCRMLETLLAAGPLPVEHLADQADARYISRSTLQRAATFLNLTRSRAGNDYTWSLPPSPSHHFPHRASTSDNSPSACQTLRAPPAPPAPPPPQAPAPAASPPSDAVPPRLDPAQRPPLQHQPPAHVPRTYHPPPPRDRSARDPSSSDSPGPLPRLRGRSDRPSFSAILRAAAAAGSLSPEHSSA